MQRLHRWIWLSVCAVSAFIFSLPSARAKDTDTHPYLVVSLEVRLHHQIERKKTTRVRRFQMMIFRLRPREKAFEMKNGPVWLNLKIKTIPPDLLHLEGALQLGSEIRPIQIRSERVKLGQSWNFVSNHHLKDAHADLKIEAELASSARRLQNSAFSLKFKGVTLHRILQKLAEFNRLKLSIAEDVPAVKDITLQLNAASRRQLIDQICSRYRLDCKVFGEVLWVRKGS